MYCTIVVIDAIVAILYVHVYMHETLFVALLLLCVCTAKFPSFVNH